MQGPTSAPSDPAARAFFDAFVEAFASFDGSVIAARYLSPYLAFHSAASSRAFTSQEEIAAYFHDIVTGYAAKGCRSCSYKDLEVVRLGSDCALATVTWELLTEDARCMGSWRESYNLCLVAGHYKVFASTDHVA